MNPAVDPSVRRRSRRPGVAALCALLALFAALATPARADDAPTNTPGRIVRHYALVSGNDFPQRDPQAWRLMGSKDGGTTWETLDVRTNESFAERQERRVFTVAQPGRFETYRLQIDRIRDGKAANSVQLAEIEPLGETPTDRAPVPLFTDEITAQGDNPPVETADKLFDGRIETKWLAHPANRTTYETWIQWRYRPRSLFTATNLAQWSSLADRTPEGVPVSLSATVVGHIGETWTAVIDDSGCATVSNMDPTRLWRPGQRLLIEGTAHMKDGRLDATGIRVRSAGPVPPEVPDPVSMDQPWFEEDDPVWAELEGVIRVERSILGDAVIELEEDGLRVKVRLPPGMEIAPPALPPDGVRVSVTGVCRSAINARGDGVPSEVWITGADNVVPAQGGARRGGPLSAVHPGSGDGDNQRLLNVASVRRLTAEQVAKQPRVRLRGVVTGLVGTFLQDETGGIQINQPHDEGRKLTDLGLYVEVEGHATTGELGDPIVAVERATVLGRGQLPEPARLTAEHLFDFHHDGQWVEVEGVVHATDGSMLLMICHGREVTASISQGATSLVKGLVDASVRVEGVAVTALDGRGRARGIHLLVPSPAQIRITEPPPADPFAAPGRAIGNLLRWDVPNRSPHRVRVEGVVTLADDQRLFLQDATGSAMAVFRQEVVLDARFGRSRWLFWRVPETNTARPDTVRFKPGDHVELVGFPVTRGYSPVLTEVTVRRLGDGRIPEPEEARADGMADGRLDSTLVTLEGVVRAQDMLDRHSSFSVEWTNRMIQALVPAGARRPEIAAGTRVRMTGVCQVDTLPFAQLGQRVGAIRLLARSPADFVVLERPPWWTLQRALAVMGVLVFVLVAASLWIQQLHRQVAERTAALGAEIHLREQAEHHRALDQERSRIAQDLHDDLGANLTQIVFLSQRVENAQHAPEEMDRWFQQIPATARKTIRSLDEIVWAINPQHDSLESLANYVAQFAEDHASLAGIRCVLDVPTVLPVMPVGVEIRHNLVLAAREALQNVVTHSGATEVRVALKLDDKELSIVIADNGAGFDPGSIPEEGNGLANMRRRLEQIGGALAIRSSRHEGTTVRLSLPIEHLRDPKPGTERGAVAQS